MSGVSVNSSGVKVETRLRGSSRATLQTRLTKETAFDMASRQPGHTRPVSAFEAAQESQTLSIIAQQLI